MSDTDYFEVEATVSVALPNALFKVKLDNGADVLCHLSGKIRLNSINVLPGDRVKVVISKYDITKGRIVFRIKGA